MNKIKRRQQRLALKASKPFAPTEIDWSVSEEEKSKVEKRKLDAAITNMLDQKKEGRYARRKNNGRTDRSQDSIISEVEADIQRSKASGHSDQQPSGGAGASDPS